MLVIESRKISFSSLRTVSPKELCKLGNFGDFLNSFLGDYQRKHLINTISFYITPRMCLHYLLKLGNSDYAKFTSLHVRAQNASYLVCGRSE